MIYIIYGFGFLACVGVISTVLFLLGYGWTLSATHAYRVGEVDSEEGDE